VLLSELSRLPTNIVRHVAVVWRAGGEEAEAVAGLLVEFRDWLGRDTPSAASFLSGVRRLLGDPSVEYLLGAVAAGEVAAGVCQLRFRYGVWNAAEDCWLEDLFVCETSRGAGLGLALTRGALNRARDRGCARVELDVNESNSAALALYEGLGFSAESNPPGARNLLMRRRVAP
jgi:ribosomal protein S18 acetylase RimI-like enzyme